MNIQEISQTMDEFFQKHQKSLQKSLGIFTIYQEDLTFLQDIIDWLDQHPNYVYATLFEPREEYQEQVYYQCPSCDHVSSIEDLYIDWNQIVLDPPSDSLRKSCQERDALIDVYPHVPHSLFYLFIENYKEQTYCLRCKNPVSLLYVYQTLQNNTLLVFDSEASREIWFQAKQHTLLCFP